MSEPTQNSPFAPRYAPSPLLERPGAVPATWEDAQQRAVALHYGDPLGEQRPLVRLVDRSDTAILHLSGADAPAYLNTLLSQQVSAANPAAQEALNLDAQGRVLDHLLLIPAATGYYLVDLLERPTGLREFGDYLQRMKFWKQVEIKVPPVALLSILGPAPAQLATHPAVVAATPREYAPPRPEQPAYGPELAQTDYLVQRAQLAEFAAAALDAGAALAGLYAWQAHRMWVGEPVAADLDEKLLAHEVPGWVARAVHLNKGCYRGQETVARVENLGQSPRQLVRLHLDGSAPATPLPGTPLQQPGKRRPVGRLGAVVHDHNFGPLALGLLKRSATGTPAAPATLIAQAGDYEVAALVDGGSIEAARTAQAGRLAVQRYLAGPNAPLDTPPDAPMDTPPSS